MKTYYSTYKHDAVTVLKQIIADYEDRGVTQASINAAKQIVASSKTCPDCKFPWDMHAPHRALVDGVCLQRDPNNKVTP